MKDFFINLIEEIKIFLKRNKATYLIFGLLCLFFIVLGIIVGGNSEWSDNFLFDINYNFFEIISGEVSFGSLCGLIIKNILWFNLIIFLINLIWQTSFLNYIFLGYQSFIFGITLFEISQIYNIWGIIFTYFILIFINLIMLVGFVTQSVFCLEQSRNSKNSKAIFFEMQKKAFYWKIFLLILIASLVCCVLTFLIIYLIFRSTIFLIY